MAQLDKQGSLISNKPRLVKKFRQRGVAKLSAPSKKTILEQKPRLRIKVLSSETFFICLIIPTSAEWKANPLQREIR